MAYPASQKNKGMVDEMKNYQRLLCILLGTLLCVAVLASCGDSGKTNDAQITTAAPSADAEITGEDGEYVDTRFDNIDFDGRAFRANTSVDDYDATNANDMIEGTGEEDGDIVNDAVYKRNLTIEEKLNVKFEYTHTEYTYDNAEANIRKVVMAGDDLYDIIINDVRSLVQLTDENILCNVANVQIFDLEKTYWYTTTMNDLTIVPDHTYILAGDYFADIIKSCHCLFHNKKMTESFYGDPEYIDNLVLDGKWTYENATKVINENYADLDGDGKMKEGDRFGMIAHDYWGNLIAFVGSAGIEFLDRSSDPPTVNFNNDRSVAYLEALNTLYHDEGTLVGIKDSADNHLGLNRLFGGGEALLVVYQRLNDLALMRNFDFDIGPIPYPKLYESDNYYTSIHDTTEMGAIPITCNDLDFVTTVLEALNVETSKTLFPTYYDVALKVKYTTDEHAAKMIDMIHDNFGSSFSVAYNNALGDFMLQCFTGLCEKNSNDFASVYEKGIGACEAKLQAMIEAIESFD